MQLGLLRTRKKKARGEIKNGRAGEDEGDTPAPIKDKISSKVLGGNHYKPSQGRLRGTTAPE